MYANMTMGRRAREPVYDGVGPRTSADGSSMGTLPRDFRHNGGHAKPPMGSPAGVSNSGKVSLGPYYAPIAEMEEKDLKTQKSVDSSELTLMEESISDFMEPFGKALPAFHTGSSHNGTGSSHNGSDGSSHPVTPTPLSSSDRGGSKSRNSTSTSTSAESELEALIVAPGVTAPPTNLGKSLLFGYLIWN